MKNVNIQFGTDPEHSLITGRNGTHKLYSVHIWSGSRGDLFIDGIGKSGRVLNAGLMLDPVSAETMVRMLQR